MENPLIDRVVSMISELTGQERLELSRIIVDAIQYRDSSSDAIKRSSGNEIMVAEKHRAWASMVASSLAYFYFDTVRKKGAQE